jgi:hypothetical protein
MSMSFIFFFKLGFCVCPNFSSASAKGATTDAIVPDTAVAINFLLDDFI